MTGAANAKRKKNEEARFAAGDLKCALDKLCEVTRGLDGDLIEAIALDSPERDAVAERGQKVDEKLIAKLEKWTGDVHAFMVRYRELRQELDLG